MFVQWKKVLLLLVVSSYLCDCHFIQWRFTEVPRQPKTITPLQYMVDITNSLSYRVLQYHSISNRNNFAFSPSALTSVMIAVYEGSDNRCSAQVHQVMTLPWDRDIVRIGYRDIHRRLRIYFFDQENPLSCLSFNRENVTITPVYETVLKFYGYDLRPDMVFANRFGPEETTPKTDITTTTQAATTTMATTTEATTPEDTTIETTTPEMTTTEATTTNEPTSTEATTPDVATTEVTTTELETTEATTTEATTTEATTTEATTTEATTTEATTTEATTPKPTTSEATTTEATTTEATTTETTTNPQTTTVMTTANPDTTTMGPETTILPSTTEPETTTIESSTLEPETTTITTEATTPETTTMTTDNPETTTLPATTENSKTITKKTMIIITKIATEQAETTTEEETTVETTPETTPVMTTEPATTETDQTTSTTEEIIATTMPEPDDALNAIVKRDLQSQVRGDRIKRNFPYVFETNYFHVPIATPPPITQFQFADIGVLYPNIRPRVEAPKHEIHHLFYTSPRETIRAKFKVYNSMLNFAYIDALKASMLELDLDSKYYRLLLMVPNYGYSLDYVVPALKLAPSIRTLRSLMTPRWVQAIIPDFQLKGNMFLTHDLQNMGILDIFEPSNNCFSPMTDEKGIYVKHIEQMININIRTRPIDQMKRNISPFSRPIDISVNHPFLFFIVDKELDLAIISGRVVNPLNVRIQ